MTFFIVTMLVIILIFPGLLSGVFAGAKLLFLWAVYGAATLLPALGVLGLLAWRLSL